MTTRSEFLNLIESFKPVPVNLGSNGEVLNFWIRPMTIAQRDEFEQANSGTLVGFRARMLCSCLCDEAGHTLLTRADIGTVNEMPSNIVEPLFDACLRLNGYRADMVDDLEKK